MPDILPWYEALRRFIEPSWSLMAAIALAIIVVTVLLLVHGDPVMLAGWLIYLISP